MPGLALLLLASQASGAVAWGSWFDPGQCCGTPKGGTCEDGSVGTPCCGEGSCNAWCCGCGSCRKAKPDVANKKITPAMQKLPLHEYPMLLAHDAASAYAESDTCDLMTPVNNWAVTQTRGGFGRLLGCGVRAFDFRPYLQKNGRLVMHHGSVIFETDASKALQDVVSWVEANPGSYVTIIPGHCATEEGHSSSCISKTNQALNKLKIPIIKCSHLANMKVGDAMKKGLRSKGGSVVAIWAGCVTFNWPQGLSCYKPALDEAAEMKRAAEEAAEEAQKRRLEQLLAVNRSGIQALYEFAARKVPHDGRDTEDGIEAMMEALREFAESKAPHTGVDGEMDARRLAALYAAKSCFGSHEERVTAFKPFWDYVEKTTGGAKPAGKPWVLQGHWQYNTPSIAAGAARHSCILWDEEMSEMNRLVYEHIKSGQLENLNFVEVDHGCMYGHELYDAIHAYGEKKADSAQRLYEEEPAVQVGASHSRRTAVLAVASLGVLGALAALSLGLRRRRGAVALVEKDEGGGSLE